MTNITRRTAIRGATAALAGAGLLSLSIPQTAASGFDNELEGLIATHRAAHEAYYRALDVESEANERVSAQMPYKSLCTPVSIAEDGSPARGGKVEVKIGNNAESAREFISAFHDNLRRSILTGTWAASAMPGHMERVTLAINGSERRAMEEVDRVLAEYHALVLETGAADAENETRRACQAEVDALAALWVYRPRSANERVAKLAYLTAHEDRVGKPDDMTLEAIIELLRNEVAI